MDSLRQRPISVSETVRRTPAMSRTWQICIVGGGPAGCAAALAAGLQPDQVLLLEAQSPWREKPCGDAITHSGIAALALLGLDSEDLRQLGGQTIRAHRYLRARSTASRVPRG